MWVSMVAAGMGILLSILAGYRLGLRHTRQDPTRDTGPVGAATGASLALLAFLLAITFSMSASRLDARKARVLAESNAISTAWLRADLLDEAGRVEARRLLEEYLDARLVIQSAADLPAMLVKSTEIHGELWRIAATQAGRSASSRLFVESINAVIDLHEERIVLAVQYRVPQFIWVAVALITAMGMVSLGYNFGLAGSFRYPVTIALAVAFGMVIVLIAGIDRMDEGFVRVSQQPLVDARETIDAWLGAWSGR